MKKIRYFLVLTTILCLGLACNRLEMPDREDKPATEDEAPSKYVPYQTQHINVPAGNKSLVYAGGTLVATCYKSGDVVLPKLKPLTKALEDYQIVNVPVEGEPGVASENDLDMVVAFEDTKNGDHDYNDLVFQAHIKITNAAAGGSTVDVDITPVAMGATLTLGLGIVLTDAEGNVLTDQLITNNCRAFLFNGDQSFINTGNGRKHYEACHGKFTPQGSAAVTGVSWYLLSAGQKLYASNYFQPCLDNDNVPQGLVLMNIRSNTYYVLDEETKCFCGNDFWQYPVESTHIKNVYPGFEQAFIEGGDFTIFANPTGRYYDAISADADGLISSNCLYDIYKEEGGDQPMEATLYYDNTGRSYTSPQGFEAEYYSRDHSRDNFILEFSNANGNAIDFERGDVIEAKITTCEDYPFSIGRYNTSTQMVDAAGQAIIGYTNGAKAWWRLQDAFNNSAFETGASFNAPLIVRISKEGIEFFINGAYQTRMEKTNEVLASILTLGTTTPLYFGLFGSETMGHARYAKATYEYLVVTRNCDPTPVDVHVTSVSVESSKSIYVDQKVTLTATVLPANATNPAVTWSSSNPTVATVNEITGEVEGKTAGTCTITATSVDTPSISASCSLTVEIPSSTEVSLWTNFATNTTSLDYKTLEIIASGAPTANQICFNNGDYIEVKLHREEVASSDRDILVLGSGNADPAKTKDKYPYMCVIGHPSKYTEIYMIPGYWWSVSAVPNTGDTTTPLYVRFGCKADGKRGCGSYSTDGTNWTTFSNGNDFEAKWQEMTNPSKSPLIIQTARQVGYSQLSTYEYVKIVRSGAADE